MANVIKYYLIDGNTPDYVITEKGTSGLWENTDGALLGLGNVTGSESGVTIFNTEAELIAYMETYCQDGLTPTYYNSDAVVVYVPFDIPVEANRLWNLLQC